MWEAIEYLFSPDFMPHGHCYLWKPGLLWLHIGSDLIIFLSYASIPFAIIFFYKKRKDMMQKNVASLFAVFILACGFTHLISIWNVWHGAYWLSGSIKLITALASLFTATALWVLMPTLLRIPTLTTLKDTILQKEIALSSIEEEQRTLEKRVKERTAILEVKNNQLEEEKKRMEAIQSVTIDRELTMASLKQEINLLLSELNRPEKYSLDTTDENLK